MFGMDQGVNVLCPCAGPCSCVVCCVVPCVVLVVCVSCCVPCGVLWAGWPVRPIGGTSALQRACRPASVFASAVIRQPKVLLLDEATSALDTESERVVQQALDALMTTRMRGVTTLSIAHRLSTIRGADMIIAMHRGRVEEVGSHSTLVEAGGLYSRLVDAQAARGVVPKGPAAAASGASMKVEQLASP